MGITCENLNLEIVREKCPYSELFWSAFSLIRTDNGEYLSLRIQSECGKMQTRITPNTDTFYPVYEKYE